MRGKIKAGNWFPLDAGIFHNEKIAAADPLDPRKQRDVRDVFIYTLAINRDPGRDEDGRRRLPCNGLIPSAVVGKLLNPPVIAAKVCMGVQEAADALQACTLPHVNLLRWEADGSLSIVGWGEEWGAGPATAAERTAAWRQRVTGNVTSVTENVTAASHVTQDEPKTSRLSLLSSSSGSGSGEEAKREEGRNAGVTENVTPSMALALRLRSEVQRCNRDRVVTERAVRAWADQLATAMKRGRTAEELQEGIDWVFGIKDDFWRGKIFSAADLCKHIGTLLKQSAEGEWRHGREAPAEPATFMGVDAHEERLAMQRRREEARRRRGGIDV